MIRTKYPASGQIQTKNPDDHVRDNPIPIYPESYHHWGGHLPFPPKDCPCSEYIFMQDGIRWLDISFCTMNKCGQAPCKRRKAYTQDEWKNEYNRREQMRQKIGVRK